MNLRATASLALLVVTSPALAQDAGDAPRRTRVILGPQLVPRFPGADSVSLRPYVDVARARGDAAFRYESADESTGITLYDRDGLSFGPAIGFEGKRRSRDVGGLDRVGFSVELGAAVQYQMRGPIRGFAEVRKGVSGHKGIAGMIGVDYVLRDADRWLWSIGPRLTLGDGRYARAYFGVTPREALATGIAAYRPDAMIAGGVTTSMLRQLNDRWGVFGYAKYDHLLGDAADSPVTRRFGTRNLLSGGAGVSYTFGQR
jgi:outer membrane protein